jgi:membrane-bound serine protease (ClpP class)
MISTVIILVCLGIFMLALEVILPGGILGICGGLCLVGAMIMTFLVDELDPYGMGARLAIAGVIGAGSMTLLVLWMKNFHRMPFISHYILDAKAGESPRAESNLLGLTGVARSDLRPTGTAMIDGKRLEVVAEAGLIAHGSPVTVVKVDGFRIVVRATSSELAAPVESSPA